MKAPIGFLLLAAACPCGGAAFGTELAARSPFLPPQQADASPSDAAEKLELRGVMTGPGGTLYCLYDMEKNRCVWAEPKQAEDGFVIVSADAAASAVEVRTSDGRIIHLKLREAKV